MNNLAIVPGMDIGKQTDNSEIIRFDRYLATNISSFSQFGNDGQLMLAIVIYIAYSYQEKDLFGFGGIDLTDFSKQFNYDKSNLFKKHQSPAYLMREPNGDKVFYTTIIGNALYRLWTEKLILSSPRKNVGGVEDFEDKAVNMLNGLTVSHGLTRTGKTSVIYEADKGFIASLNKAFTLIDVNLVPRLRKPNLDYVYFYLQQLKDVVFSQGEVVATPTFSKLCDLCRIAINKDDPKHAKKYLLAKLKKLSTESDLNFDVVFFNLTGRWDYGVSIIFNEIDLTRYKVIRNSMLKDSFDNYYIKQLAIVYAVHFKLKDAIDEIAFHKWCDNNKRDLDLKKKLFIASYKYIFGVNISVFDHIVKDKFKQL